MVHNKEIQRERMRMRRLKLKTDPEKLEIFKAKERERSRQNRLKKKEAINSDSILQCQNRYYERERKRKYREKSLQNKPTPKESNVVHKSFKRIMQVQRNRKKATRTINELKSKLVNERILHNQELHQEKKK